MTSDLLPPVAEFGARVDALLPSLEHLVRALPVRGAFAEGPYTDAERLATLLGQVASLAREAKRRADALAVAAPGAPAGRPATAPTSYPSAEQLLGNRATEGPRHRAGSPLPPSPPADKKA